MEGRVLVHEQEAQVVRVVEVRDKRLPLQIGVLGVMQTRLSRKVILLVLGGQEVLGPFLLVVAVVGAQVLEVGQVHLLLQAPQELEVVAVVGETEEHMQVGVPAA